MIGGAVVMMMRTDRPMTVQAAVAAAGTVPDMINKHRHRRQMTVQTMSQTNGRLVTQTDAGQVVVTRTIGRDGETAREIAAVVVVETDADTMTMTMTVSQAMVISKTLSVLSVPPPVMLVVMVTIRDVIDSPVLNSSSSSSSKGGGTGGSRRKRVGVDGDMTMTIVAIHACHHRYQSRPPLPPLHKSSSRSKRNSSNRNICWTSQQYLHDH